MKQLYLFICLFICLNIHSIGQNITTDLFQQPANTSENMTITFNSSSLDQYEGGQIGAFYDINGDGYLQCVGLDQITTGFFGLELWGDDPFTTELDGLSTDDIPQFAILFNGNVIPFNESPQFTGYVTNEITNITDTNLPNQILYPLVDLNFLTHLQENYPQTIINDSLNINATAGITFMYISELQLTDIDGIKFFTDLNFLICNSNQLTSLPELPQSLISIECIQNQLTSLPELPQSLKYLYCWGNELTSLPEMPQNLLGLYCSQNQLVTLPQLPEGLSTLSCYDNLLTILPEIPEELRGLYCSENQLTILPEIPQGLEELDCSNNQLTNLPELSENLQLINFTENPLECVSNYLPQFQELNSYPLCEESFSFCEQNQWYLSFDGNTGSNMTILLQESFITSLNIQTDNAYLVATTEAGLVVGSSYLNNSQTSLVVWGDDSFTTETDGASDGQLINLHLIDSNLLFDVNTSFNYLTNNLDLISNEVSPVITCIAENLGCTDESACNFNLESIIEDGSCTYSETYFDCNGYCINDIDGDSICDELEVLGCTSDIACNYDFSATDDDSSCTYAETNYDCSGNCLNDSDEDGICDEIEIEGCTDDSACNYNSLATDDDSSCTYAVSFFDCNGNCINDIDEDGSCDEIDNCLDTSNSDQVDIDEDGEGDACDYDDGIGINEFETERIQLIKMIDILGREHKEHNQGMVMFYIYQNGMVEKRVIY